MEGETLAGGEVLHLPSPLVVTPGLVPPPAVAPHYHHLGAETSCVQAVVVRPDLPGLSDGEDLVASQPVAGGDPQPAARLAAHRVQAALLAFCRDGAQVEVVQWQLALGVDCLQVPAEGFALKLLPQLLSGRDVAAVNFPRQWVETEVEIFPAVHPDLGQPGVVVVDDVRGSPRKGVGRGLPEHVAHSAAGGDQESSPTHPHSEGHLQVLPAPDLHALVVGPEVVEIFPVYAEQAARHRWRPERKAPVSLSPLELPLRDGEPAEVQFPVEASPGHVRGGHVLESFV